MPKLPSGVYDLPVTVELERALAALDPARWASSREAPDSADSHELLARHIANLVRQILQTVPEEERLARQATICNELIEALGRNAKGNALEGDALVSPAERLAAVYPIDGFGERRPREPEIPVSQSDLLVNTRGEPNVGSLLLSEIESADRIDLIVAFIRWSGLRLFEEKLRVFLESGKKLRVITTTYTGSTERKAIEHLVRIGAEVKVSYQTDHTRLHAKSWLFHRDSGFSTVYIGSSNLTTSALVEGVEWNVRLSQTDAPTIVQKFQATFDAYWADPDFELYNPDEHRERFDLAVAPPRDTSTSLISFLEVQPWPHQREMLEKLHVERYRHGRWKNLVVAATGTGKTVVAALDYRRLCEEFDGRRLSLLFVAHRKEILQQSLLTFRQVLRDGSFGELYVDGHRPEEGKHVFGSVQSFAQVDLARVDPAAFDVVIVDEFHHASLQNKSYAKLLEHFRPKVLLGLTATPERTDGESILHWFDGRIAVELRLWDALERGLLSPFHYFGIHDEVDLSRVKWVRGTYEARELENLYTANDARLRYIFQALEHKVSDLSKMRALGFCVGVSHAEYMARKFNEHGIPAAHVVGTTAGDERDAALRKLRDREINALFAVDIFNEGVDVPEIDTVLFLRPTESSLIFLQQLGRGLRRSKGKDVLTVLDFIGNANRSFRFDLRYRALTGASRREVEEQVEDGFPYLPAGCSIQLDRESSRIILENLRNTLGRKFPALVQELRGMSPETTLARFLHQAKLDPEDLYRTRGWSWTRLQRAAFAQQDQIADRPNESEESAHVIPSESEESGGAAGAIPYIARRAGGSNDETEDKLLTALPRLLHLDDQPRIAFFREILARATPPDPRSLGTAELRMLDGLLLTFFTREERDREAALHTLWSQESVRSELLELLTVLEDRAEHETPPLTTILDDPRWNDVPLALHARYSLDEAMAAIGRSTLEKPVRLQGGVLWDPGIKADCFFITLEKSEKHYSPTTRYRDYAIAPDLFHWESQSTTREASDTGQRYIHHRRLGSEVFLFVRQTRKLVGARTAAYTFLGPAEYVRHEGEKPMAIVWGLRHAMPQDLFKIAKVAPG